MNKVQSRVFFTELFRSFCVDVAQHYLSPILCENLDCSGADSSSSTYIDVSNDVLDVQKWKYGITRDHDDSSIQSRERRFVWRKMRHVKALLMGINSEKGENIVCTYNR